jgi:hypothetical protein
MMLNKVKEARISYVGKGEHRSGNVKSAAGRRKQTQHYIMFRTRFIIRGGS